MKRFFLERSSRLERTTALTRAVRAKMDDRTVRLVNLMEVLEEQYPDAPKPPKQAMWLWSEDDARAWFASNGRDAPNSEDDETMTKRWFPGLERSGTRCDGGRRAKFRILCFPNAGNTEDMFTSEGTGERRAKSPLLEWAKKNDAEVLSVQYPGRANRKSETYAFEIWQIVEPLLHVVASKLDDVPYVVVGHSVGAWVAFQMLQLLRGRGIRMPEHVFLSSFPFPDIPHASRPWQVNCLLEEPEFKEECRRWDVNEIVFGPVWEIYEPMMRADFHLFDKYEYAHIDRENFNWPLTVFHGYADRMITEEMVRGWETHTSGAFEFITVRGHHLFPLEKEQKAFWLQKIVDRLDPIVKLHS